jgi:peptidoglycan/xylan/chitin deacetylase (PgdA/CDA1 family)
MRNSVREIVGGVLWCLGIVPFYGIVGALRRTKLFRALVYHQVVADVDGAAAKYTPGAVTESEFKIQVEYLMKHFKIISLEDVLEFFRSGRIPDHSVLLTFDDGYRNVYQYAFPILKHYGVPALIFCTGNVLKGGSLWCDQLLDAVLRTRVTSAEIEGEIFRFREMRERLSVYENLIVGMQRDGSERRRDRLGEITNRLKVNVEENSMVYLRDNEIREMQAFGIEFGSHTVNHPLLSAIMDSEKLKWEVVESIRVVEGITGRRCVSFAYPFGSENSYTDRCIRVLKDAGIRIAFTTVRGGNKRTCNPYLLHRFIVKRNSKYFFRLQLSGLLDG